MPPAKPHPDPPFTARCEDAGISTHHPDPDWFEPRSLDRPRTLRAQREVFAAHAWAYSSADLSDDAAVTAAWNALPDGDLDYLIKVCSHPSKRPGEEPIAAAARFLTFVRSPPASPPSSERESAGSKRASPTASAASGKRIRDVAGELRGSVHTEAAAALADPNFARMFNRIVAALSPAQLQTFGPGGGNPPPPPPPPPPPLPPPPPPYHQHHASGPWMFGGGGFGPPRLTFPTPSGLPSPTGPTTGVSSELTVLPQSWTPS